MVGDKMNLKMAGLGVCLCMLMCVFFSWVAEASDKSAQEKTVQEKNEVSKDASESDYEFEAPLDKVIKKIEARIAFENKQVVRQQNSNQYLQLQSVLLNRTEPQHPLKEYTFRVTVRSTIEERDAFIKVISAKMFEIDCKSTNFEHKQIGNRYIYVEKSGKEIFRFEDSMDICAEIEKQ